MRILIDTANTKQIKEMYDAGVICGATTNPTLKEENLKRPCRRLFRFFQMIRIR